MAKRCVGVRSKFKSRFSRVLQGQPGVISLRMQYPKEKRP